MSNNDRDLAGIGRIADWALPAPMISPAKLTLPTSVVNPAEWMHERLVKSINEFEEGLDQEHEVGARLVSFGAELTFHIEDVGFWGPDIIRFYGIDSNNKQVQLLQHITQLSVLLVAVNKTQEEPRRIGFRLMENLKKDEEEDEE